MYYKKIGGKCVTSTQKSPKYVNLSLVKCSISYSTCCCFARPFHISSEKLHELFFPIIENSKTNHFFCLILKARKNTKKIIVLSGLSYCHISSHSHSCTTSKSFVRPLRVMKIVLLNLKYHLALRKEELKVFRRSYGQIGREV